MLTLYAATGTGSVAPQALLAHLGVEHQIQWIDYDNEEHHADDYLKINPRGQLPALQLEDGTVVTESLAIVLLIAERYGSGFMPATGSVEHALTYRWMAFAATNLYEGLLRILYPHSYTTSPDPEPVKESADIYLHNAFSILEYEVGDDDCLVGNTTGVADIYVAMLMTWYPEPENLRETYPGLSRVFDSAMALPSVKTVFQENELI